MKNGGQCVMITGTTMMQEWCVANWGSLGDVSIDHYSICRDTYTFASVNVIKYIPIA